MVLRGAFVLTTELLYFARRRPVNRLLFDCSVAHRKVVADTHFNEVRCDFLQSASCQSLGLYPDGVSDVSTF